MRKCLTALLAFILASSFLIYPASASRSITSEISDVSPLSAGQNEKLVLALYYPWYDMNSWSPNIVSDFPSPRYISADRGSIARQFRLASENGIDGFISAWLGRDNQTDWNLAALLSEINGSSFKAGVYFETNSPFLRSQQEIIDSLRYVTGTYFGHPNYLRYQGKPVLFFWALRTVPRPAGQSAQAAWKYIRDQVDPGRQAVWIGEGDDFSYLETFDGIHPYSVAWAGDAASTLSLYASRTRAMATKLGQPKLWVPIAMPGYDDLRTGRGGAFARSREDGRYYATTFAGAIASQPDWAVVITSWNEWVEGTQIEPSDSYGNKYLNLTREWSNRFKTSTPAVQAVVSVKDTANKKFYTETSGKPASEGQGYYVGDDGGVRFLGELDRLGGVQGVGYPISQKFQWNGFTVQAMQKGVLQWRSESGKAWFVNVLDLLHEAGKDDWLLAARSVPKPLAGSFDAGKSWDQIVKDRVALLDPYPAIKAKYNSVADPLTFYGLPSSKVEDMGNHYAVRLQRAVIQQWKVDTAWAKAGQVVVANGGDLGKEAGLYPESALALQTK